MSKNVMIVLLTVMTMLLLVSLIAIGFILSKTDTEIPDSSVTTTEKPTEPVTSEPVITTEGQPVYTPAPDVSTDSPAVSSAPSTQGPAVTTSPVITTRNPVITTAPPINTIPPIITDTPVITTQKPVVTTAPPVITTTPHVITTAPPVITTAPPVITTAPPVITTAPPVITTAPPVITTAPVITTGKVTTAPGQEADHPKVNGSFSWSTSNKYWQIFLDWETVTRTDTTAQVKFTLRFYGTSIGIGSRNAVLTVNGEKYPIAVPGVTQKYVSGQKYNVVLNETTVTVPLKNGCADVGISFDYPAQYTFSNIYYGNINIPGTVKIQ